MNKSNGKRILLLALIGALLLGVSGCLIKPDKTVDEPTDPVQVMPFETATPSPTPGPTEEGAQSGWEGGETAPTERPIVTAPPIASPTTAIVTPPPTQIATAPPIQSTPRPTADGTLRVGSSGSAVKNLQQKLKNLGYYTGSVDGAFGAGTETALKAFQKANGLSSDGIAGSRTLSTLNSNNAKPKAVSSANATSRPALRSYTPSTLSTYRYLQLGGGGNDVKKLQERLRELGYFHGSCNGSFGADTEAAVIAFQQRNGLWADGVAGEDTQRMLFSNSALANKKSEAGRPGQSRLRRSQA